MKKNRRIQEEKAVVEQMIRLYCRRKEGNARLCPQCEELLFMPIAAWSTAALVLTNLRVSNAPSTAIGRKCGNAFAPSCDGLGRA